MKKQTQRGFCYYSWLVLGQVLTAASASPQLPWAPKTPELRLPDSCALGVEGLMKTLGLAQLYPEGSERVLFARGTAGGRAGGA